MVFIGPMGSGKSSIGRRVADMLGVDFVDTDSEIVKTHGAISDVFTNHGEAFFRDLEEHVVQDALVSSSPRLVALGGGAILSAKTRELLKGVTTVLLMTNEETVLNRVNLDKRPLLREDPNAWKRILDERMPLYSEVATVTFDTVHAPKDKIALEITNWLRNEHTR